MAFLSGGISGGLVSYLILENNSPVIPNPQKPEIDYTQLSTAEEQSAIEVVQNVAPAVVSIIISKEVSTFSGFTGPNPFPFDDFFEFGFPGFEQPQLPQQPSEPEKKELQRVGGGTGFVISEDGLILTNKHVISDPDAKYTVVTNEGQEYEAEILATDPFNDFGVVKIEATGLPVVALGDSDKIQIGQTVVAIGFSLGEYKNTVTKGVVSGVGRQIVASSGAGQSEQIEEAIQTDAAINPGNSGGPLLNLKGEVIGINTAIDKQGQSVGFAIPINAVKPAIESVKTEGRIIRPQLGVRYVMITEAMHKKNNLEVDHGALLVRGQSPEELAIVPGSAADKAGLEENDIILEINGKELTLEHDLRDAVAKLGVGDSVEMKVYHDGEEKFVTAELGEFAAQ